MQILLDNRTYQPLRVFCIGKNYDEHIKELGGKTPDEPVVFMKPVTSLVAEGEPLRHPPYGAELHHEVEAVLLIGQEAKQVEPADALKYIAGVTVGLDLTLRDVQARLKKSGHPWELSKAFEQSAPIGRFVPCDASRLDVENWTFECRVNGALRQSGNTRDMLFPVKTLISALSRWWVLRPGDIIYTGTPSGVGPLKPGDRIEIQSPPIGAFSWTLSPAG